jgi:hypothetical protein
MKKPGMKKEEVEELDEISTKTLAGAAKAASDPDSDYYYGKSHDPQKFVDHAKKTKDAKSAAAVQGAADKSHYPRDNHTSGYDKLTYRTPPRVTAAGKANKQDIKALKTKLKEEVEELDELSKDTLNSYVKKSFSNKEKDNLNTPERQKGLRKATSRLYKEDEEHIEELSTPTLASYVKKVGHEGAWTKKRTAGVNSALNKVKQNSMKSEEMDIDAINGVRMHTFKERFGDRDNNN